jgi:divalent metal cation (Fe/Co/Zn/Cd) transporter
MVESVINSNAKHAAIRRIQWLTIGWMTVEVVIALIAALRAHSVALTAFGGDSAIELLSAAAVLARFRATGGISETLAKKITGWLLAALAAYIAADSLYILLVAKSKPEPSYLGIELLVAAAVIMPWLGRRKRLLAAATNSSALRDDAVQSSICAYLAWIALAGLLLNAVVHVAWADPVAALCLLPIIVKEANESM